MQRDPQWLAKKNAHEVFSGFRANQATGSVKGLHQTRPEVPCCGGGGAPAFFELPINNPVPTTWEPANGCEPNFGTGTSVLDDNGDYYCDYTMSNVSSYTKMGDQDFFNLCGPGAADVALWYWPDPPNALTGNWVTDTAPMSPTITTEWNFVEGNYMRMRGYMAYLAWQISWPSGGLPHAGMMDNTNYPSFGTTLYGMVDALNWESSGRSTLNGFYAIQWWNQASQSTLNADVVTDTYFSGVPVVAEVDAQHLPNWHQPGGPVYHFITIIGYDNNTGNYYYTDTCGHSTMCNPTSTGTDGKVHEVLQSTMWEAITAVPVDQSTAPYAGDGGWVW